MSGKKKNPQGEEEFPLTLTKGHAAVKIYKTRNRGKELFCLAYNSPEGRVRINFNDLERAKREANTKLANLAQGDLQGAKLGGQDRQIYVEALESLKPTGVNLLIATRQFATAFEILGHDGIIEAARFYKRQMADSLPDLLLGEAIEKFIVAKTGEQLSKRYLTDLRLILARLSRTFVQAQLKAITADDLQAYMGQLKMGAVARNNHQRVITVFFNHAKSQGWISKTSTTAADALGSVRVTDRPVEIYTPAEVSEILNAADPRYRAYLALIAFGGLRADELADSMPTDDDQRGQLRWQDIDFQRRCVVVPAAIAKTSKKRKIPISDNLMTWLEEARLPSGYIYDADPRSDRASVVKTINDQRAALGAEPFVWKTNALRHSFGSYRMEIAKNAGQVALEMGNSAAVVLRHYHELVHSEDAALYWAIGLPVAVGKVVPMVG